MVRGAPPVERRIRIGDGAHERVVEPEPGAGDANESCSLGRGQRLGGQPQPCAGAQHGIRVPRVLGRRDQQQIPAVLGQGVDPAQERRAEPFTHRSTSGERDVRQQPLSVVERGELGQGERVPPGDREHRVVDMAGQLPPSLGEQQRRLCGREPAQGQFRQVAGVHDGVLGIPRGEQDRDRFRRQPARGEDQRRRRRPVEPRQIVDRDQQRTLLRDLGEQGERPCRHQQIRGRRIRAAEGSAQRLGLCLRERGEVREHRTQQLMQPAEHLLYLGLHA